MEVHEPQADYNCPTCNEKFTSSKLHKEHYKSDFHRKVTCCDLGTVFNKAKRNKNLACERVDVQLMWVRYGLYCRKKFNSANTLKQHVESKKHDPHMIVEPKEKIIKNPVIFKVNSLVCLFCTNVSLNQEENINHMKRAHTFFIPQENCCTNINKLLEYLQEKIEVGNLCIFCDNKKIKDFASGDAVRKHMTDKGHTFMKTEDGYEEYQDFYDFSSQFEEKLKEQGKVIHGIEYKTVKVIVKEQNDIKTSDKKANDKKQSCENNKNENEEDWQDEDNDDEEWQSQGDLQEEKQEQIIKEKRKIKVKTYKIMKPTLTSNEELLLPNGKILGHRKYRHLYKQSYRIPHRFATGLRQIGSSQYTHNALIGRRSLLEVLQKEKQMKGQFLRDQRQYVKLGVNNNNLQKHFRVQQNAM